MHSGFFNSMKAEGEKFGDRVYMAEDWAQYFAQFIGNGVYANPATSMQVRAVSGLIVRISAGSCFINGYTGYADGTDILTLNYGSGLPRIDRIVLRLDLVARSIYPVVIMGAAAESPVPPNIVRNNSVYDLCIAQISVAANSTSVSQASITDMRSNSSVCGFVAGLINQIDTTDLFLQYDAEWELLRAAIEKDEQGVISAWESIINSARSVKTVNNITPNNGNISLVQGDIPSGNNAYQMPYFIQGGISSISTNVGFQQATINFSKPFNSIIAVVIAPCANITTATSSHSGTIFGIKPPTKSQVTIWRYNSNSGVYSQFHWIAIGML